MAGWKTLLFCASMLAPAVALAQYQQPTPTASGAALGHPIVGTYTASGPLTAPGPTVGNLALITCPSGQLCAMTLANGVQDQQPYIIKQVGNSPGSITVSGVIDGSATTIPLSNGTALAALHLEWSNALQSWLTLDVIGNAAAGGAAERSTFGVYESDTTRRIPFLWSRSAGASPSGLSTAGDPGGTSQVCFIAPYAMHDLVAQIPNVYTPASGTALAPNPVTVKAYLVYPTTAAPLPLTFDGQSLYTIGPNGIAYTDVAGVTVAAAGDACIRTVYRISLAPVTLAIATGSGGSLPATARYYKVTTVAGPQGESGPSAEVNATPSASGTITLTIGADPLSVTPTAYNVYEGASTGNEVLLATIPAAPNGGTTTWTDTGAIASATAWTASQTSVAVGTRETSNSNVYMARVGGNGSTTAPSGNAASDGAIRWIKVGTSAPPSAQQYPLSGTVNYTGHPASEAINTVQYNGNGGDFGTVTGTGAWNTTSLSYAFGATALLGIPAPGVDVSVVAMFGDSILEGYSQATTGVTSDQGYLGLALQQQNVPYWMTGRSSELLSGFLASLNNRLQFAALASDAISAYGINDCVIGGQTAAQLETNALLMWQALAARVARSVYQTTLLPQTTSTDNWATATNQTPGTGEACRSGFNTWLRAGAPATLSAGVLTPVASGASGALYAGQFGHPLTAVIDADATLEVNSANIVTLNGGRWISNGTAQAYTLDGTHPTNLAVTTYLTPAVPATQLFAAAP